MPNLPCIISAGAWNIKERTEEQETENRDERRRREVTELLQELRIVLPGVQVLFAFLFTVPFSGRFTALNPLQRDVFFATLLCTTAATVLLIAPSAHHRLLWRQGERERRLKFGNMLTILGLTFLVPAMVGAVFLISDLMFGALVVGTVTAVMTASFVGLWFIVPLWLRGNSG